MSPHGVPTNELAISRHAQLAEAFEIFARDMGPFIDLHMSQYFAGELSWTDTAANRMGRPTEHGAADPLFQLLVLRRFWGPVFAPLFKEDLRALVNELIEARNQWAHFSLPNDLGHLDRSLLSIERLLAPVNPDNLSRLRAIRARIKNPVSVDPDGGETYDQPPDPAADAALTAQLDETEAAFAELQGRFENLTAALEASRRAAAGKQLRISTIEQQLTVMSGRSELLAHQVEAERSIRYRLEWLFVSFIVVMLFVMVLLVS